VYGVLCRWLGRGTAAVGVMLTAVWSLSIIYGQEVRVYAFLPPVYLLLVLLAWEIGTDRPGRRAWLALGLVEWVALHLHYNSLFLLIFLNGWLVIQLWRRPYFGTWLKVQIGVGLASLPWAVGVLLNWPAVQAEASVAGFTTELPAWEFVLPQVWVFHLTGLVNVLDNPLVALLSQGLFWLLAVLLLWHWWGESRSSTRRLFLFWLGPLFLGFAVWLVRSYSHPRYIALFAAGLVLLLAYLLTPRLSRLDRWASLGNLLRVTTAVLFIWLSGWGLHRYFFDPAFAKDDMRAVVAILEETAALTDLILVPYTDWSLLFIYDGDTPVQMPNPFRREQMWSDLSVWTTPPTNVFALDYEDNLYDWQGVLPFALESAGNLVNRWQVDDLTLSHYRLNRTVVQPDLVPRDGRFGDVAFLGSWVAPTATTADTVTVALQWQLLAPVPHNYAIVLRVDDGTGLELAYQDDQLLTENGRPTNRWDVGEVVTTYHFLPFVKGTPPLSYEVNLRVYLVEGEVQTLDYLDGQGTPQGQDVVLGEVQVKRPLPDQLDVYGVEQPYLPLPQPLQLAEGLQLTHASLERSQIAPGQPLRMRLAWQSSAVLPDLRPRLVLRQAGQDLSVNEAAPAQGAYPTNLWQPGDLVWEQRLLTVPATAEPGPATLFVMLGERIYPLGAVEISAEARSFEPPEPQVAVDVAFGTLARLVGFDPPAESVPAGQPIPLTLYWQSLGTGEPVAYTVFAQVLDENGRLVAQHDAPPENGRRPTTGWVEGEYIRDEHLLAFREEDFTGEGQIVVGLYDPESGVRLTLPDGRDAFPLPFSLLIEGK
jgi:hypothetical protein